MLVFISNDDVNDIVIDLLATLSHVLFGTNYVVMTPPIKVLVIITKAILMKQI